MTTFVVLLILAVLFFGGGFLWSVLWYAAVIWLALALISFVSGRRTMV